MGESFFSVFAFCFLRVCGISWDFVNWVCTGGERDGRVERFCIILEDRSFRVVGLQY